MFDGWCATTSPTDPLDLPIDRFLNLVYAWLIRNIDSEEELTKLDGRLWVPPKGEAPAEQSIWSAENETRAFSAFAASIKGGSPRQGSTMPNDTAEGSRGS